MIPELSADDWRVLRFAVSVQELERGSPPRLACLLVQLLMDVVFALMSTSLLYYMVKLCGLRHIHANLKCILFTSGLAFLAMASTKYLVELLVTSTQHVKERVYVNLPLLALCHLHSFGSAATALCMTMLVIEQTVAYKFVDTYEGCTRKLGWLMVLSVVGQGAAISLTTTLLAPVEFDAWTSYDSCMATDYHPKMTLGLLLVGSSTSTSAALVMLYVRWRNRQAHRHRASMATLSARYQQTLNSNTSDCMAHSLVGYLLTAYTMTAIEFVRLWLDLRRTSLGAKAVAEIKYIIFDVFVIYHVLCFFSVCEPAKQALIADLKRIFGQRMGRPRRPMISAADVDTRQMSATYFSQLETLWRK